eukprot:PITA_25994
MFVGYSNEVKGYRLLDIHTEELFIERSVKFGEDISHAPVDELVTKFPSPLIDEYADETSDQHSDDDESLPVTPVRPPVVEHRDHTSARSSEDSRPPSTQKWHSMSDILDDPASIPLFEEDPQPLLAMEPSMPMHAYMMHGSDPQTYAEANGHPEWEATMDEEYNSLIENQTWDLVPLPSNRKLVRCKWLYWTKKSSNGQVSRYKARLVAKGFQQVHGVDYDETFSPVAKMDSIRLALSIAAVRGWEVHHMDVKNAFLHGDLEEEIYMEQPPGYMQNSSLVCKLKKSLYGLKEAPRAWYAKMDSYLLSQNFVRCKYDSNVYFLKKIDSLLIIVLYVDDLLITGSSTSAITNIKTALHKQFSMTDMGLLHFFLGLEIHQRDSGITISQPKYAKDLLARFHMSDCKPAATPFLSGIKLKNGKDTPLVDCTLYRQLVGSLLYLTHSRPGLSYAGTITYGIHYAANCSLNLIGFTNSDWAGDTIDRKSTSGYVLSLGSGPICWSSKKQAAIALSSAEAEYRGAVNATIQAIWLQHFLSELGISVHHPTVIWCDNQSTLKFCRDPMQRQRTKHIEIHMHFIRELIHDGIIDLQYCPSSEQIADIFTKTFTEQKFRFLRNRLWVKDASA